MDTTYRVISIADNSVAGRTAATAELAKLAAGGLDRTRRLGVERTEWAEHFGKPKAHRTVLLEAESRPDEWLLGDLSPQS